MSRDEYFRRWADLHGGMDPAANGLVSLWLTVAYALARPLAAIGASPNAVTMMGLLLAAGVAGAAAAGGGWLVLAGVLALLAGVVDNLDGAVAVLTGRTTRWGYVLDSVCDRLADVLFLLAFWLAGAPAWVCLAAGVLTMVQEYARARAAAGGMDEIGVVSVWERPSRVLVTGMFLLAAGLLGPWQLVLVQIGAAVSLGLAVIGCAQVLLVVRSRLRAEDAAA